MDTYINPAYVVAIIPTDATDYTHRIFLCVDGHEMQFRADEQTAEATMDGVRALDERAVWRADAIDAAINALQSIADSAAAVRPLELYTGAIQAGMSHEDAYTWSLIAAGRAGGESAE